LEDVALGIAEVEELEIFAQFSLGKEEPAVKSM